MGAEHLRFAAGHRAAERSIHLNEVNGATMRAVFLYSLITIHTFSCAGCCGNVLPLGRVEDTMV